MSKTFTPRLALCAAILLTASACRVIDTSELEVVAPDPIDGSCPDGFEKCGDGLCHRGGCGVKEPCDPGTACDETCVDVACGPGEVCEAGACVRCEEGAACDTNPGRCLVGRRTCGAVPACEDTAALRPVGASCGDAAVCDPAGACAPCDAGAECPDNPNGPCRAGRIVCETGAPICTDGPDAPHGTACGELSARVCVNGACVECEAGAACGTNPGAPCRLGVQSCDPPACADDVLAPAGTSCGKNRVCDEGGQCIACAGDEECSGNPGPCRSGRTSCAGGSPVCEDGKPLDAGTGCGSGQVCDGNGACVDCSAGAACTGNPDPCLVGIISCAGGAAACVDGASPRGAGSPCGEGRVCDGSGQCVACSAGDACSSNPNPCLAGFVLCVSGAPGCADTQVPKTAGTTCGQNRVCDGSGACVSCTAGGACSNNPNPCRTGRLSCASGAPTCEDTANNVPPGTSCGKDLVCSTNGTCVSCSEGASCPGNPNPCRQGLVTCASGGPACVDGGASAAGTSCGANQVCNGSGTCVSCSEGAGCSGNPNPCLQGVTSCASGGPVCVNGTTPRAAGTSCGNSLVCNGSGACVSCTAGGSCSGNPNACVEGVISCSSGAPVCIDSTAIRPWGTPCGGSAVCDAHGVCGSVSCSFGCIEQWSGTCTALNSSFSCGTGGGLCMDCTLDPSMCMCELGQCARPPPGYICAF